MDSIARIDFKNKRKMAFNFEVVDLQVFFSTRPHNHLSSTYRLNFWMILYIIEGKGEHEIDFKRYSYESGDIVLIGKNQVHRFMINHQVKGYVLLMNESFFIDHTGILSDSFLKFYNRPYLLPVICTDAIQITTSRKIMDLMYNVYIKSSDQEAMTLIKALFRSFIEAVELEYKSDIPQIKTKVNKRFNEFRELVEINYMKLKTVEEYANIMNITKKTINQATRQCIDLSAKQYIINRIILEIKRYLSQGDLLNYEISNLLGFDEPGNMTKFFKHYEGISPKAFREMNNEEGM